MGLIVKHIPHTVDLNRPVKKTYIDTLLATEDNLAHRFDITIKRGGEAVTMPDGTAVIAYFIRYSDNATVPINNGSISGNVASITLTNACYSKPGQFAIIIKVSVDNIINTIFYGEGTIFASSTEKVVDEENVIPSLSDLLAQIEAMEAATNAAKAVAQDMLIVRYNADTGLADKTQAEIRAAVAEKRACIAIDSKGCVYNYVGAEDDHKNKVGLVPTFRKAPDYDESGKIEWDELQILSDGTMHIWGNTNVRTPNPKTLQFTGAVKATYDGSEKVTVEIPEGGPGGGGGMPEGGEPNMMLVTDADGNAKWEARIPTTGGVGIIPETVLTTDSSEFYYREPLGGEVVVGNTYTVKWNGVGYNCEAAPFEMEGITWTVLGNIGAMMGGTPSAEPFVIIIVPPYVAPEMGAYAMLMSMEGLTEVTVCIPGGVKIDNSALDVDWIAKYDNVGETIVAETVGQGNGAEVAAADTSFFVEGNSFIAYVDNVRYDLTVVNYEGQLVAGNLGLVVTGAPGNGEPFYITANEGKLTFFRAWTDDNDALHTIAVYLPGNSQRVPNQKLPNAFLPGTGVYYVDLAKGEVNRGFDEIVSAYNLGRTVCCRVYDDMTTDSKLYYLTRVAVYNGKIYFSSFLDGEMTEITIDRYDRETEKYNKVTITRTSLTAST